MNKKISYIRYPRGGKQAKINECKSIPPDNWDDIANKKADRAWKIGGRILKDNKEIKFKEFAEKLKEKEGIEENCARTIYYNLTKQYNRQYE